MFGPAQKKPVNHKTPKPQINRSQVLSAADKLRARGKHKKAIAEYRKLIELDPNDADVHSKLAPLFMKLGNRTEALKSFRAAADGFVTRGFVDRAIAMYAQAASAYPTEASLWEKLGRLNYERGRKADGVKALMTGAVRMSARKQRPDALRMLEQALTYDPLHLEATVALCRLLKKMGKAADARARFDQLAKGLRGPAHKRLRALEFKLFPGFGAFFRWLRG